MDNNPIIKVRELSEVSEQFDIPDPENFLYILHKDGRTAIIKHEDFPEYWRSKMNQSLSSMIV